MCSQHENSGHSQQEQAPRSNENEGETEQLHSQCEREHPHSSNRKRQRLTAHSVHEDITAEALICMKSITEAVTKRDSSSIFGEFVADALRNSTRPVFEQKFAKQKITQILFDLENGAYADHRFRSTVSSCSSRSSSSLNPSPQDYHHNFENNYDSHKNVANNDPMTNLQEYVRSFNDL